MRKHLQLSAYQFANQAQRLLETFNATLHSETETCCKVSHKLTRASCVVNLNNQWSHFNRNLFVNSSNGGWTSRSGILLSRASNLSTTENAIDKLRLLVGRRPPYWEPNWTVASEMISMHRLMGVPNYLDVSASLGSSNSASDEVRLLRNFIVHKNSNTAKRAQSVLALYGINLPIEVGDLLTIPTPSSATLFEYWVNNLTLIALSAT